MSRFSRITCYFDVVCPNSWITVQALMSHSSLFEKIEFEPVCDFKIGIIHNGNIWNQRRNAHNSRFWRSKKTEEVPHETSDEEGVLRRIDERGKKLLQVNAILPPDNWETTYKSAVSRGSIVPQLFLTSVKQRNPELYQKAIIHIGSRLWDSKLPIHYGCHMSTVARELGIPFKTAEDMVSKLSTPENRNVLNKNCKDAVSFKLTEAPGLVSFTEDGESKIFENFCHLLQESNPSSNPQSVSL